MGGGRLEAVPVGLGFQPVEVLIRLDLNIPTYGEICLVWCFSPSNDVHTTLVGAWLFQEKVTEPSECCTGVRIFGSSGSGVGNCGFACRFTDRRFCVIGYPALHKSSVQGQSGILQVAEIVGLALSGTNTSQTRKFECQCTLPRASEASKGGM